MMISRDDSLHTLEFPDHYVITPSIRLCTATTTPATAAAKPASPSRKASSTSRTPIPLPHPAGDPGPEHRPRMIPYGRQSISDADVEAVLAAPGSDWLTQGPAVPAFEAAVAARRGRPAVAVSNATAALHLACLASTSAPAIWSGPRPAPFVASATACRYCGADVDFVDIDPATSISASPPWRKNLPAPLKPPAASQDSHSRHFSGQPADLAEIADLARRHGCRVIEDASHAIGATYRDEPVGSGRYSDITVLAFTRSRSSPPARAAWR